MAQTSPEKRPEGLGDNREYPVYQSTHLYPGEIAMLDSSGYLVTATATTGLVCVGVVQEEADNSSGSSGDINAKVKGGIFGIPMKSGDEPTAAEVGDVVYASTNAEVCKTSTGKSVAGVLEYIDSSLAFVHMGLWPLQVGLLAANNLSDVGTAATARANIGANEFCVTLFVDDLVGANAKRVGFVAPRAVTFTSFRSVLLGAALTTGDATLTGKIAGTAVTDGAITITQSGSAIGDKDSCSPSALNVCAAGDFVEFLVGGTNDAAGAQAYVTVFGTY